MNLFSKMSTCFLCLDEATVPVIMERFACFRNYKVHCNSDKVVCFACYVTSLSSIDSCMFCRAPIQQGPEAFRIDLSLVSKEDQRTCFVCKATMSHYDLVPHLLQDSTCVFPCPCGQYYTKDNALLHMESCSFHESCAHCNEFHPKGTDARAVCPKTGIHCRYCDEVVVSDDHWDRQCIQRSIRCPDCSEIFPAIELVNHFSNHVRLSQSRLRTIRQEYENEKTRYKNRFNQLCKLYQDVFPDETDELH